MGDGGRNCGIGIGAGRKRGGLGLDEMVSSSSGVRDASPSSCPPTRKDGEGCMVVS
jgi:hypothetical protein